jgi:hypothetical protein
MDAEEDGFSSHADGRGLTRMKMDFHHARMDADGRGGGWIFITRRWTRIDAEEDGFSSHSDGRGLTRMRIDFHHARMDAD